MSPYIPKAYISIEDERFYEHKGVDIKRTGAATVTYVLHKGKSSFGGSTITQQLVKNLTNDKEDDWQRKVREMGIEPREYSMEDLYVATLMAETDYNKTMSKYGINNLDTAIMLGKEFLEDEDSDLQYGEKLGSYYFNVVCVE